MQTEKFYNLPETPAEFRFFMKAKGMPVLMTEEQIETAVYCWRNHKPLPKNVRRALYKMLDLGDSCGCDSDHRMRNRQAQTKKINYAHR